MAAEFIGSGVLVTLRKPPNAQVKGTVRNIVGQQLTLENGMTAVVALVRLVDCRLS